MASYFEMPAASNAPAPVDIPDEQRDELRGTSLLSPQVSRILDDLQFEDKTSSSDDDDEEEEGDSSHSESYKESRLPESKPKIDESISRKSRQTSPGTAHTTHASKTSTRTKGAGSSSGRDDGDKPLKSPRNHMARFQSLRSNLFQTHIENSMKQCHQEAEARERAATDWKAQHEKRQGYSRPHTPEKAANEREGLGRRISTKLRRLTSREPPTIANIEESAGNLTRRESTATDDENEAYGDPWQPRQSYESSIDHSDIDELVRWVSRKDPPSDGERQVSNVKIPKEEDNGRDSLGHSDIEELVRHASRKSISIEPVVVMHTGYSDESTASDSEPSQERYEQHENSAEGNLSRWVSRRDGAMAGPVRQQRNAFQIEPDTEAEDSDVPEIGRWRTHHDNTSGESIADASEVIKKDDISVLEAKRGRSRDRSPQFNDKGHLQDDDVDELVRWVSRRDSKQASNPDIKHEIEDLKRREDEKKREVGMSVVDRSLAPEDLDELLAHVRGRNMTSLSSGITPAHV